MSINNLYTFLNKGCTDIEYITYTHLGQNKGGVTRHKVSTKRSYFGETHYFYVVKKEDQLDYDGRKYTEFKILDLDQKTGTVSLLHKERVYKTNYSNKQFWLTTKDLPAIKNKIYYYIDVNSEYE